MDLLCNLFQILIWRLEDFSCEDIVDHTQLEGVEFHNKGN